MDYKNLFSKPSLIVKSIIKSLVTKSSLTFLSLLVVISAAVTPAYYFYTKYQQAEKRFVNPSQVAKGEMQALVAKVSKLVQLPTGEDPSVATVSNKEKLKDNPFLGKAENGDKLLIYTGAKKVILYRPSKNIVVDITTVNIGNNSQVAGAETKAVKIAVYNGTKTTGVTSKVEDKLNEKKVNYEAPVKENAAKQDYEKTIVVDLTGKNPEGVKKLAELLGYTVSTLPEGEKKPEADFLIIAASDLK